MTAVPLGGAAAGLGSAAALTVERTTAGGVRVTCSQAPGWARTARTPIELAHALTEGWREAEVASYAQQRGEAYDLQAHDRAAMELSLQGEQLPHDADEQRRVVNAVNAAAHEPGATGKRADPLAWKRTGDGAWLSPSGRRYGAETQVVQRVVALRQEMGVDTG